MMLLQPLGNYIRLRRLQRNLTQERLAKLAGVSRRQLSLLEDGQNVSVLFLLKIAGVLELTEVPVGSMRLRSSTPDLANFVVAADVLQRLQQSMTGVEDDLARAASAINAAIERALAPDASAREIDEAADRLAQLPPEESDAAAETLRALTRRDPAVRTPRSAPAPRSSARGRTR